MENYEQNFVDFSDTYIKLKQEERAVKKTAGFVGWTFIILMVLPFVLSSMITSLLRVFGMSPTESERLFTEPMFSMLLQIFLSMAMFILPLGVILYGEHLKLTQIISFEKPKKEFFFPIILLCIGISAFANIVTNMLTSIFVGIGIPVTPPEFQTPKGVLGFIVTFLAIAVTPALVEELAIRGVVMGCLKRYGKGFAIGVSSILFAMMHGNLAQLPFAFILGVAIGFAVIKTDSIWTGVIIHFINNGISVVLDEITTNVDSLPFNAFINAMYFALCILAFFVGLYLLKGKTKELIEIEDTKYESSLSQRIKWFFSAPAAIISIVITALECIVSLFIY